MTDHRKDAIAPSAAAAPQSTAAGGHPLAGPHWARKESAAAETATVEVSVVMPCLNEADTLETCIRKAQQALQRRQIDGEIVVADNGSTDGSQQIATRLGARVVRVDRKGYGSALMGGIAAVRGKFIIMGDADDSYDFLEVPNFVAKLREGYDLVQGCRLPSGGGTVLPGAMPWLHRWWGNPMFSKMAQPHVSRADPRRLLWPARIYESLVPRASRLAAPGWNSPPR